MVFTDLLSPEAWQALTRLGEAQLLLPPMLLACLGLAWRPDGQGRALARRWLAGTAAGALLTTASKVAFIGYGLGVAALDFTGFSGHALFASAVLPPLLRLGEATLTPAPGAARARTTGWGTALGAALALAVGVSRVAVQAHSWSEVMAGLALGGGISAWVLSRSSVPVALPGWRVVPWLVAGALALAVDMAPASRTHDWVTRLALATSGRPAPFLREHLQRHRQHPLQLRL